MNFRIRGLEAGQFSHLFALSEAELAAQGALRKIADGPCPCRVSLTDATPGDEVILVNYEHHAVASPYRMRFAIYVRQGEKTFDAVDAVPDQLRRRTLAVRGFDDKAMMTGWEVIEGIWLEEAIERQFADTVHAISAHPFRRAGMLCGEGGAGVTGTPVMPSGVVIQRPANVRFGS